MNYLAKEVVVGDIITFDFNGKKIQHAVMEVKHLTDNSGVIFKTKYNSAPIERRAETNEWIRVFSCQK